MDGESISSTTRNAVTPRQRQRLRVAKLTAAVVVMVALAPLIYGWGIKARVQASSAVDLMSMIRGEAPTWPEGSPAEMLVPVPAWASALGGTDFGGQGPDAVVGLAAQGTVGDVSSAYCAEMADVGWVLQQTDEGFQSCRFDHSEQPLKADVTFVQAQADVVTIVVNLRGARQ